MRTTLTLDPDVAASAQRLQQARGESFKTVVNEALRRGLLAMAKPSTPSVPYRTPAVDLGPCLAGSLDEVTDVLAVAEGEEFR